MTTNSPIEIGLLSYEGAQLSAIHGITDLFLIANQFVLDKPKSIYKPIRVSHWAQADAGIIPRRIFDTMPECEGKPSVILVPPTLGDPPASELVTPYRDWLRQHHASGGIVASVCAGAFFLADTGLLDGRVATTHWMYEELLAARYPKVTLDIDRLIVDDGDIITAGGVMAWTDLGLKILDRFIGPTAMIKTARILLLDPPGREQSYYSTFSPKMMHGDAAILKVQHWLQNTEAKDIASGKMANISGLQERTFQRRFIKATGMSPSEYCQRLRMGKARELLQFSLLSVENIAWEVGYKDPGAFRKTFLRVVGLTPSEYRHRFVGS